MFRAHDRLSLPTARHQQGFTLIELMIVVAILAIILALALPVYSNYTIRSKISEGLSVAMAAKVTVAATCIEDLTITELNNASAGYRFAAGTDIDDYIERIEASGTCTEPLITVTTKNTGQSPDPILLLRGEIVSGTGKAEWRCSSDNTPNFLLPETCRSS